MEELLNNFNSKIADKLQILEQKRIELKSKGVKDGLIASAVIIVLGLIISMIYANESVVILIVSSVVAIMFFYFTVTSKSQELSVVYKQEIITQIVEHICQDGKYEPEKGISISTFVKSNLFHKYPDRYNSEDLISGKIDRTSFYFSEVHAEEKIVTSTPKGGTQTRWVDIFRGFIFIADFHKDFKGQTLIFRNSWLRFNFSGSKVKLEDPEFEKRFDVESTDQVEARYILSPSMIERITELDKKLKSGITVSFMNSSVMIAIPDRTNHFETSIWNTVDMNVIKHEFETIYLLIKIVSDLNLNTRIWTKE